MEPPNPIEVTGRRVTVMGLGLFGGGLGAALYLLRRGARVTVTDLRSPDELEGPLRALKPFAPLLHLGGHDLDDFTGADLVVASPAVPGSSPYLQAARKQGVRVETEITLFLDACPAKVVGITGSNGKTTTTSMTHAILSRTPRPVHVGGNIGVSLLDRVDDMAPDHLVVLELSSFQLEYVARGRGGLSVAALLNLTPNHLDRHGTLEEYGRAKAGIFHGQGPRDFAVLNADDERVGALAPDRGAHPVYFSLDAERSDGFLLAEGHLIRRRKGQDEILLPSNALPLKGLFNRANALAASACAMCAGATAQAVAEGLSEFTPVEHRLEEVRRLNGIQYVNDSVATTPESTLAALEAFDEPVVLIAGGYDKGLPLGEMARAIAAHTAGCILLGSTGQALRDLIEEASGSAPLTCRVAASLPEAVHMARDLVPPGGVVLLSPGAASYDMFRNFTHRGEVFRETVMGLTPRQIS